MAEPNRFLGNDISSELDTAYFNALSEILNKSDLSEIEKDSCLKKYAHCDSLIKNKELVINEILKDIKVDSLDFKKIFKSKLKEIKSNEKVIKKQKKKGDDEDNIIQTSLYMNQEKGIFAEQVYGESKNKFCIYNTKTKEITYEYEIEDGSIIYAPILAEEVEKGAILLPSHAEEYESDDKLDSEIIEFVHKWLDIPNNVLQFGLWNIKRSWVFQKFHTLNYLRALGDTGQGKTRFLDTFGSIHYKPINTSGATTSAPVFRIIEKWRGTLIMDEADFNKSDESQDIIKIINMGYEKGKHVMRCDQNDANKIQFFDPYCPKILATRKTFTDKAVESRCITHIMSGTNRKDIPLNLNEDFWSSALKIRNKLLMWRFKNYLKIDPNKKVDFKFSGLEPRVEQIVTSFVSLFNSDISQLKKFSEFISKHQEDIIEERKGSFAGSIVGALHSLLEKQEININAQDVIIEGNITNLKGNFVNPRSLTSTFKSLGFGKTESRRVGQTIKRCIPLQPDHLTNLFQRYGFDVTVVTVITESPQSKKSEENSNLEKFRAPPMYRYNSNTVTEEPTEIEELITPYIGHCKACGANPCHFYAHGNYFCSKDCINQFKAQQPKKQGDDTK